MNRTNKNWRTGSLLSGCVAMTFAAVIATGPAQAESAGLSATDSAHIDDAIHQLVPADAPGLSLAIVKNGVVAYTHGYGLADLDSKCPVTPETRMEIGSVTKQVTAAAILQLVEGGKLSLDDKLSRYVPEYTRARDVTIRQLLNQTSGIPDYIPKDTDEMAKTVRQQTSLKVILARFTDKPLDFTPGSKWAYSNSNYFLLGLIVERLSDRSFDYYVGHNILDLAGMERTTSITAEGKLDDFATGYAVIDGKLQPSTPFRNIWAFSAGDIVSDVGDLAKWDAALLSGKIVKPENVALMTTPVTLPDGSSTHYGMGWGVDRLGTHKMLVQTGGTIGFGAVNAIFPDDHLAVIALTNDARQSPDKILAAVVTALYPDAQNERISGSGEKSEGAR